MALPLGFMLAGSALSAGLSIMGANARNAAISKQAKENYSASLLSLDQQRDVAVAGLMDKATDVNAQIGAELTNLGFQEKEAGGKQAAVNVETNIYGITAAKRQGAVAMDAAMMEDNIIQKGEAAMKDVQINLSNSKYQYEAGVQRASQTFASSMNQMATGGEITAGALSAGMSGAMMGYNLGK